MGLLPPVHPDVREDRDGRARRASSRTRSRTPRSARASKRTTPTSTPTTSRSSSSTFQDDLPSEHTGQDFPQDPTRAAAPGDRGGVQSRGTASAPGLPAPEQDLRRPRHRGQRAVDGVRQPRRRLGDRRGVHARPVDRREEARTATTSRTRRARTSSPASATRCRSPTGERRPEVLDGAARRMNTLEHALPRHVRHRVHDRAGPLWILQTRVGKRTAFGEWVMAHDMLEEGLIDEDEALLRVDAEPARGAVQAQGRRQAARRRSRPGSTPRPGAATGAGRVHRRRGRSDVGRGGGARHPRAPRDHPRRLPRHDRGAGHPDERRAVPTRTQRSSPAARASRPSAAPTRSSSTRGRSAFNAGGDTVAEGDSITIDGFTGDVSTWASSRCEESLLETARQGDADGPTSSRSGERSSGS